MFRNRNSSELDRQDTEIEVNAQPEQVQRQEASRRCRRSDAAAGTGTNASRNRSWTCSVRHSRPKQNAPEQLDSPQITTRQSQQPELEARQHSKMEANPQNSQPRMETVERQNNPVPSASQRLRSVRKYGPQTC